MKGSDSLGLPELPRGHDHFELMKDDPLNKREKGVPRKGTDLLRNDRKSEEKELFATLRAAKSKQDIVEASMIEIETYGDS